MELGIEIGDLDWYWGLGFGIGIGDQGWLGIEDRRLKFDIGIRDWGFGIGIGDWD